MLIALDVGNTETVVGLYELGPTGALVDHWRFHTNVERTSDEHAVLIMQLLDMQGASFEDDITGIVLASSVPRVTASLRDMAERYAESKALVLEPGVKTGMPILYENPKDVGPDRIADAVAAYDLYGGPTIVVDFGTGTTVEGVSAKGEYLGGSIMPGVEISLEALFGRTSLLHKAELVRPRSVIGKTTAESIQSGALYGFAAQVDGIVRLFEKEMGESTVVATGGLSGLIVPFSETIEHHDPWLTLHGLRLIYLRNQSD